MKQILVVSDSHHHNEILNKIFKAHPEIDTCIHCGDLQDDVSRLAIRHLLIVSGNNDFDQFEQEICTDIENFRCWIVHGHRQDIESGTQEIIELAQKKKADIVCFGHTHHPQFFMENGIYYLNPGSTSFPRGGKVFIPTYAVLTLGKEIECHFFNAKTQQNADHLVFKQEKPKKSGFFSFFKRK